MIMQHICLFVGILYLRVNRNEMFFVNKCRDECNKLELRSVFKFVGQEIAMLINEVMDWNKRLG